MIDQKKWVGGSRKSLGTTDSMDQRFEAKGLENQIKQQPVAPMVQNTLKRFILNKRLLTVCTVDTADTHTHTNRFQLKNKRIRKGKDIRQNE